MEHVNGATLRGSHRAVFDAMRPIVRILRISGFADDTIRSAVGRACHLYARSPARGIWLDHTRGLGLDQARIAELTNLLRVWSQDPDFVDQTGHPKRLILTGGAGSFRALLRRANCSLSGQRALAHLRSLGSVQPCDRGRRVRLVSDVLIPVKGKRFVVAPVIESIRWFGETLEHNLCEGPRPGAGRWHRWAICTALDPARLSEIERHVRSIGQTAIESIDEKLSTCAMRGAKRGITYGVALYVFVDRSKRRRRP
jgi:hypothetical protein